MPLPVVAIAADDSRLPAEARVAVVASCARASGDGRCVERSDPLAPAARYLALVRATSDRALRVDLRSRADNRLRGARELVFSDPKLGEEHWNSTGLVIAALVADADAFVAQESPPPEPLPELRSPATAPARSELWLRVALCGVAAPGFDFDRWRLGTELRLSAGVRRFALYPVLATRWSAATGGPAHSRTLAAALGLGVGLVNLDDKLGLNLEASAVSDTLLISVVTREGTQQSFRVRYGARLGLSTDVQLMSELHALFGAEASWLGHRAVLELDGQRLGAEPRVVPGFTLGLSLSF